MRRVAAFFCVACCAVLASVQAADRPIFLVTPAGVWQSTVVDGVPGNWVPLAADVIVQGFTTGNPPVAPPVPDPPAEDPVVKQIADISKATLKDKDEATAVAAIVDSVANLNLSPNDFREALEMSMPIADTSLEADGRLTKWSKQSLAITQNAKKLKAGLVAAFNVAQSDLDAIHTAATGPPSTDKPETAEAVNWQKLIAIIKMILTLLENLGISAVYIQKLGGNS